MRGQNVHENAKYEVTSLTLSQVFSKSSLNINLTYLRSNFTTINRLIVETHTYNNVLVAWIKQTLIF